MNTKMTWKGRMVSFALLGAWIFLNAYGNAWTNFIALCIMGLCTGFVIIRLSRWIDGKYFANDDDKHGEDDTECCQSSDEEGSGDS